MPFDRHTSHRRRLSLEQLEARELLTVTMSPQEQLLIELVNRARANPALEAARFGIDLNDEVEEDSQISTDPKQPLAPHQALTDAAGLHSEDMLRRDYFGHETPEGTTPSDRAKAAGYPTGAGENIAWFGQTQGINRNNEVYERHQGLFLSVGHRVNMMRESWREVGAGVRYGTFSQVDDGRLTNYDSIMVGTLFGSRRGDSYLTGVAISDHIFANNFYEIGEGLGGVTITAVRAGSGETYTDVTDTSGGYAIEVPQGTYTITASGGAVRNPITVRGVHVTDENRKIDFNISSMPTGDISGDLFHDRNGNHQHDADEPPLPGRMVFLDLDRNGSLDSGEPTVTTSGDGGFSFTDLWPGEYAVQQQLPAGWRQTTPNGTIVATLRGNNDAVGVSFGSQVINHPPQTRDDAAVVVAGETIQIDVLDNDSDPDNNLAASTIQIVSGPDHGTVSFRADLGELTYTADITYTGSDAFRYTVADDLGARSAAATVRISVASPRLWHNAIEPRDVSGDGLISSGDALLVIREINLHGATNLSERNLAQGPPYYDVNGDNVISSNDALLIIRELNRRSPVVGSAVDSLTAAQATVAAAAAKDQIFADIAAALLDADILDEE